MLPDGVAYFGLARDLTWSVERMPTAIVDGLVMQVERDRTLMQWELPGDSPASTRPAVAWHEVPRRGTPDEALFWLAAELAKLREVA